MKFNPLGATALDQSPADLRNQFAAQTLPSGFKSTSLVEDIPAAADADTGPSPDDLTASLAKLAAEAKSAASYQRRAMLKGNTVRYLIEALQELDSPDARVESIEAVCTNVDDHGRRRMCLIFR